MKCKCVAVIWAFNPDIELLRKVLQSVIKQVDYTVIVDNASRNFRHIKNVCKNLGGKITLIRLNRNYGVRALNVGMAYAIKKFNPIYILLLDDDTIVHPDAISKVLNDIERMSIYERLGTVRLSFDDSIEKEGKIKSDKLGIFSGCIIKTEIIKKGVKIREEFFLDQADYDFFERIRKQGFKTLVYGEKLVEHRPGISLGIPIKLPFIKKLISIYEPPWRYYYIVRNSTILLFEGKIEISFWMKQLIFFIVPLIFVDGIRVALRALVIGLAHALLKRLGYLDPQRAGLLSTRCKIRRG